MKCSKCGLVNFKTATNCKPCGEPLLDAAGPDADDSTEAWRDSNLMVLTIGGAAPPRCMQCNSTDGVTPKILSLGYYPHYNLVLLLVGFVYYKTVKLEITLCEPHMSNRSRNVFVTVLLMIAGVVIFIVALGTMSALFFAFGLLAFGAGLIYGVIRSSPVSISEMDKSHVWLKGVSRDYLAALPKWTSR